MAVSFLLDQFRLDPGRRAGHTFGNQGQHAVHHRRRRRGAADPLDQLGADLTHPLPGDAIAAPDFGQRVLPAVFPAVIADQDFAVPLEGRGRENFDEFPLQRHFLTPVLPETPLLPEKPNGRIIADVPGSDKWPSPG